MLRLLKIVLLLFILVNTSSCNTVSKKIDEKAKSEEENLIKWLNQPVSELEIVFGPPNKVEQTNNGNKNYIYISEKLKIKCQRDFEINKKNVVVGFSSKNCF